MNLSDPSDDDDSSTDDSIVAAKRPRLDTYGASSTTSHGSAIQEESDDDLPEPLQKYSADFQKPAKVHGNYPEQSSEGLRLSRSSLSENCSSPNESFDDFRAGFDDNEVENGDVFMRPNFQTSNESFYHKNDQNMGYEDAYSADYSETSKRMMSIMGFRPGKGLGKHEHGRVEPVEASAQKGRRGLGMKPSEVGTIPSNFKWSSDDSIPEAKEEITWLPPAPDDPPLGDLLEEWLHKGAKKLEIDDETDFVDPQILKGVLNAKTIFDSLDDKDLRHARFRSNPYETIGAVIFLNRAAVKMANIDAVFDFMFTEPKDQNGKMTTDKSQILYFADVCAGPGGFSEYILYRKGWRAKGFGFTLKGPNDFKLSDFYAGSPETFNPYYGVKEDGNVFDPANLTSLKEYVLKQTDDKGVHFLMADGGFSVEGQENLQEILSKQLYLCQCLAALMLVRTGGHFVVKLFDVFTLFSVSLIYLMYRCFDKVCIHKPVTSRPANSERYLICFYKKLGTESVEQHLFSVNAMFWNGLSPGEDILGLVPLTVLQKDTAFYEYIYKSNCILGERQIKHLLKIASFSADKNLKETSQAEMKKQCLILWKLPDQVRTHPEKLSADDTLMAIISLAKQKLSLEWNSAHAFKTEVLTKPPEYIENKADLKKIRNVYDWQLMFLGSSKQTPDLKIFLSCGGKQLFQLDPNGWRHVKGFQLTMPAKTLIYGEIIKEYKGEGNNQIHSKSLHIVDAMILGGIVIAHYELTQRIHQCNLFCTALNKPFDNQSLPMSCKRLYNLEDFPRVVNKLEFRAMKRGQRGAAIESPDRINRKEMFYVVGSMLFLNQIKEPWRAEISKSSGHKYYHYASKENPRPSEYHIPGGAAMDMVSAYCRRIMWPWGPDASAILDGRHDGMSRKDMEDYIRDNIKRI